MKGSLRRQFRCSECKGRVWTQQVLPSQFHSNEKNLPVGPKPRCARCDMTMAAWGAITEWISES